MQMIRLRLRVNSADVVAPRSATLSQAGRRCEKSSVRELVAQGTLDYVDVERAISIDVLLV